MFGALIIFKVVDDVVSSVMLRYSIKFVRGITAVVGLTLFIVGLVLIFRSCRR